ncbi:2-amino-4-hydroxy-6-hydroxymethyldihydropteridine diphosphokinase [Clostridiaceae bacterium HSG29]|nr:2-amino-4-hydroxy-6-hydroxymethyldihydropteridine diphosphokinase [Clostridiaceae bacterium HSG29]
MNRAYLSLGSNIGNSKENILKAYEILENNSVKISKKSSFYETDPYGYEDQDVFVNSVIEIETNFSPYELLDICHLVEKELKRRRIIHWGPRTIDVDILLFNDIIMDEEFLIIPHKEMTKRAFVLVPLLEINSEIEINGKKAVDIVKNIDTDSVRLIDDKL